MYKRHMSIEVKDADVKKAKLGEQITIICKGTIKDLHLGDPKPEEEKKKRKDAGCCGCGIPYTSPSRIEIELESQKVEAGENAFTAMTKDEEED